MKAQTHIALSASLGAHKELAVHSETPFSIYRFSSSKILIILVFFIPEASEH